MPKNIKPPSGWLTVRRVTRRPLSGPTYNLAVADDESYVADGIVVHNCRSVIVPMLVTDFPEGEAPVFITNEEVGHALDLGEAGGGKGFL